jgi:hypothetical protein
VAIEIREILEKISSVAEEEAFFELLQNTAAIKTISAVRQPPDGMFCPTMPS